MRTLSETLIPVPPLLRSYFKKQLPEDIPYDYTNQVCAGFDPEGIPIILPKDPYCYDYREALMPIVGYTLVTKMFCEQLATFLRGKKVLEIMAGTGCLTYGLRQYGIDVHATDDYSEGLYPKFWIKDMEQLDCIESIQKYGRDVDYVLLSWCALKTPIQTVLKLLKQLNPKAHVIYIGEEKGNGMTNDALWNVVTPISLDGFREVVLSYRAWYGLYDRPYLLRIE